ncbi:Uu.00g007110.m01.CDS01 [Anthostomella pinea]|uniref:Uu.00g007110.m01.CDS01 n=1 Tax=Anthostomella pinea TaxID=933095 RepID=A0AAI8VLF2_9PEZI|nr:Uu.00g007110.m01.CDS01 [Anthostomella pinea]
MHSDSEQYSAGEDMSNSPSSSPSPPMVLYQPPNVWSMIRGAAINLFLPFVNGMMLGFGELFAHEAAFRLGWGGTKVRPMMVLSDQTQCAPRHRAPAIRGVKLLELPKNTNETFQVFPLSQDELPMPSDLASKSAIKR